MKTLKNLLSLVVALVFALHVSAAPFVGLGGQYPDGYGAVWSLWPCQGDNVTGGDVNFDHVQTDHGYSYAGIEDACETYWIYYFPQAWGQYGFSGTGIQYAKSSVMAMWDICWADWGDPNQ